MSEIGRQANILIIQGERLVNGEPATITLEEWLSIYNEIGSELRGVQAKRIGDLAFKIVRKQEANKRVSA